MTETNGYPSCAASQDPTDPNSDMEAYMNILMK